MPISRPGSDQIDGTLASANIDLALLIDAARKGKIKITLGSGLRVAQDRFTLTANTPSAGQTRLALLDYTADWAGLSFTVDV